jgi:hypothetical protein
MQEVLGVHITLDVTWPATVAKVASSGTQTVELWTIASLTLDGTNLTGMTWACGTTLPDLMTTQLAGNEKIGLTFPDIWDKSSMPRYAVAGTQSGTTSGSTITFSPQILLLGLDPGVPAGTEVPASASTYLTASTAWPTSAWPQFMSNQVSDDDGDGHPGITLVPSTASGYSLVPTSVDYAHTGANAVYIVSRNEASISGMFTSATDASGSATVSKFENHVVGCADAPSVMTKNCSMTSASAGPGFVDAQRPVYTPGTATFKATTLPAGAKCTDVRSALP